MEETQVDDMAYKRQSERASFLAEVKSLNIKTTASQDKVGILKLEFNAQGNEALVNDLNRLYVTDDLIQVFIQPRGQA